MTGTFAKSRAVPGAMFRYVFRDSTMSINNITSATSAFTPQRGAVIHSVAATKEHRVHYGVQSATFVRTVFPGQAAGTYRINGMLPTWRGAQITANPGSANPGSANPGSRGSGRSAGSPPVPYPPRNASAYYFSPQTRIIPNPCFKAYG